MNQSFKATIGQELASRGHQISLIAWEQDVRAIKGRAGPNVDFVTYSSLKMPDAARSFNIFEEGEDVNRDWEMSDWLKLVRIVSATNDPVNCVKHFQTVSPESCSYILKNPNVLEALQNTDFIVAEASYPCATFSTVLFDKPFAKYHFLGLTSGLCVYSSPQKFA